MQVLNHELITLPEHLSSHPVLRGIRVTLSSFICNVLEVVVCPFVLFLLAIVLSVLLRFSDSDYPFIIFELFLLALHNGCK